MSILIVAEHNNQELNRATLHAITAAKTLGEISLLIAGEDHQSVVEKAKTIDGVTSVLVADAPHYAHQLPEELAPLVVSIADRFNYIGATATVFGKNIMPRIAALLDRIQISDLTAVQDTQRFERPIYAGNAIETIVTDEEKLVLTFRATAFDAASDSGGSATVEEISPVEAKQSSRYIGRDLTQSDRPELTEARVVVSGGRALQSKEQFDQLLTSLADPLHAAIGASRAAVDAGFAPNDYQVGQTGKIVAPELYIALGISGAIQHVAGIKESRVIVAINNDADAPIFNVADYGLVGDIFTVVPELVEKLKSINE